MKFTRLVSLIPLLVSLQLTAQEHVRNVIMMIPDGTSSNVLTLARWYEFGICPADRCFLAVDPYLCGMVRTFSSDAPIGDSAPTGSCYATGYPSQPGFVAMYPVSAGPGKDLIPLDPSKAYQPLITLLEAARLEGKSTGLVVTSDFFHATPADFAAHTPHRWDYGVIATQMVHNHLNVVFGGGLNMLGASDSQRSPGLGSVLKDQGYKIVTDYAGFRQIALTDTLIYGLFAGSSLPYDLDRDPAVTPSLAEMTRTAIRILSQNPKGFFLMVEGSKVDWAAHNNDPVGTVTEFIAFDKAVQEAMHFANRDGYTAVIVCPDHATGGITIGNARSSHGYDTLSLQSITGPLKRCRHTATGMADRAGLWDGNPDSLLWNEAGIRLTGEQRDRLSRTVISSNSDAKAIEIAKIITENSYIGFTTTGHTGDDVFLAVYHPGNYRPTGLVRNTEINRYMTSILGLPSLDSLTSQYFCIDSAALKRFPWRLEQDSLPALPRLVISLPGKNAGVAVVEAFTDEARIERKQHEPLIIPLPSVAVYVKETHRFYIPKDLYQIILNRINFTKK
jgi:alkaline phosphatase